jgi:hypothetical protein
VQSIQNARGLGVSVQVGKSTYVERDAYIESGKCVGKGADNILSGLCMSYKLYVNDAHVEWPDGWVQCLY